MFATDELDAFSIDSWDATFRSLNSWVVELGKKAGSGTVPSLLLAVGIAAASQSALAYKRNFAIADAQMHGPPVLSQEVARFESVSAPQLADPTPRVDFAFDSAIQPRNSTTEADAPKDAEGNPAYSAAALNAELRKLQRMHRELAEMVSIDPSTIRVATLISGQIPSPVRPSIGFNAVGNVFLHFKNKRVDAYLTIERRAFHLFCKVEGQENFYLDNEPLFGKRLPSKIRDKFSEIFAT